MFLPVPANAKIFWGEKFYKRYFDHLLELHVKLECFQLTVSM
jgi:hypothetical protein